MSNSNPNKEENNKIEIEDNIIIPEEELSEDKYKINQNGESIFKVCLQ